MELCALEGSVGSLETKTYFIVSAAALALTEHQGVLSDQFLRKARFIFGT